MSDLHRSVWVRIGISFGHRFNFIMLMPVMTVILTREVGGVRAGALLGALAVAEIAAGLVSGRAADRFGRRPVLLASETTAVAAYAVMLTQATTETNATGLVASYAVAAVAGAFALPASDATIVDRTTTHQREITYTVLYWSTNLALATGALTGGFLYPDRLPLIVTLAAGIATASLLSTLFLVPESKPDAEPAEADTDEPQRRSPSGYAQLMRDGLFLALFIGASLRSALEVQINYYAGIRIADEYQPSDIGPWGLSWTPDAFELLGFLRAENTLLIVAAALLVRHLVKAVTARSKLMLGTTLFTIGTLPLAVSNNAWILIAGMAVLTIGELIAVPTQQTLAPALAPVHLRTRYLAVYGLNLRLGMFIASVGVSLGSTIGGTGMMAFYLVCGAIVVFLLDRVVRHSRTRQALDAARSAT